MEKLSKTEKRDLLEDVFNSIGEGVVVIDREHTIVEVNPAALELFGRSREELIGRKCYEVIHGEDAPCREVLCPLEESRKAGVLRGIIHEHLRGTGEKWIAEISATPIRDKSGRVVGIVEINRDVTRQKQVEREMQHLNRVLKAINEVSSVITREKNANSLLQSVCEILQRVRGYRMVWIGVPDEDTRRVVPVAKAGVEDGYLNRIVITLDDSETGMGPTGMAIKTGRPQVVRDISRDENYAPWRDEAMKRGYRSSAAVPIVYGDHIYGTINVYSESVNVFTEEEIELLTRVGEDLGFALRVIEDEEKKRQAEKALRRSVEQHAVIARLGELFMKGASVDVLMQEAVRLVARALGAEFCKILWLEDDRLRLIAGVGWRPGLVGRATVCSDTSSQAGYTLRTRKPVLVEDFSTEKRFSIPDLLREHGVASGISVPMIYMDKVYGVMGVHSRRKGKFSQADADFLQSVANIITAAFERIRTEEILKDSQKKLRELLREMDSILHTIPAAVLTTDTEGNINYFNRQTMEYLGKSEGEIFTTSIGEHFLEPEVEAKVREVLSGEAEVPVTLEATLLSGRAVYVSMSPMRDEENRIDGAVVSFVDITQQKEAQEKLKRAYEELREIDELKSNIIANVSHELRTPITIAKGFIELAMVEENEEDRRNELESAIKALHRLNDIVEDLIEIATVQRGSLKLHRKRTRIEDIVRSAVEERKEQAEERGVRVDVELEYRGEVVVDPFKLKRAILNLLDNAIKFNRPGGRVRVEVREEEGGVRISVSDTGIGIPEERLEEVFKPLTQLDPSPTRRYGGTGTGLAVTRRIVEAHGGRIWVESEVGRGSTFHIFIPAG